MVSPFETLLAAVGERADQRARPLPSLPSPRLPRTVRTPNGMSRTGRHRRAREPSSSRRLSVTGLSAPRSGTSRTAP